MKCLFTGQMYILVWLAIWRSQVQWKNLQTGTRQQRVHFPWRRSRCYRNGLPSHNRRHVFVVSPGGGEQRVGRGPRKGKRVSTSRHDSGGFDRYCLQNCRLCLQTW